MKMKMKIKFKIRSLVLMALVLLLSSQTALASQWNGDAIYREGGWLNYLDHAGIFYDDGYDWLAYEIKGSGGSVDLYTLDSFIDNQTYYGGYTVATMDSSDRQDVLNNSAALDAETDISYVMGNIMETISNPGLWITTDEITKIRCDGVVEYAFEWNLNYIWGKTDDGTKYGTPQHFDVSNTDYKPEHDNLGGDQPWFELSPKVQRGASGTEWTRLETR